MPLPALPGEPSRLLAFREILAIKSPSERIQAFTSTQEQFSNMNSGLSQWIVATTHDLPEHAALLTNGGRFSSDARISPAQGKFPAVRIPSGQPGTNFNASPQTGSYSPAGTSPGGLGGNTHQVQAKRKDLLHTAGIFGGKANVAAKGLFAKGKSKFRVSGGGDKVDT
jgi:hypothetical protein